MKGISAWLFSKVVMLIFVLVVFATVLSFYKAVQEREKVTGAYAIAEEIKSRIEASISGPVTYKAYVPLPETIPLGGGRYSDTFTILIFKEGDRIAIGIMDHEPEGSDCNALKKGQFIIGLGVRADVNLDPSCVIIKRSEHSYITVEKDVNGVLHIAGG